MAQVGIMRRYTAYGVDGCRAGWFYIAIGPCGQVRFGIVNRVECLVHQAADVDRILFDIPIGLPSDRLGRECDEEARRRLKSPRRSSVFPVPVRAVLDHTDNYDNANETCQQLARKGLSQQTFAILPKIKEVDGLLRTIAKARRIVREVHPEVCFWALAECEPMEQSKKSELGQERRLEVLCRYWTVVKDKYQEILKAYPRRELSRDDILDAAAAAVTALADESVLRTLPVEPPKDDCGLPMEMVYVRRDEFRTV